MSVALLVSGCGDVEWFPETNPNVVAFVNVTVSTPPSDSTPTTATIKAFVKKADGSNVSDGTAVTFTTTGGTLSAPVTTTVSGEATVTLTSDAIGVFTVTAQSGTISGNVQVKFKPKLTVTATPTSTPVTVPATITVTVNNPDGSIVADGTAVTFTSTGGTLSAPSATTTSGIATVTFSSTVAGTFTISVIVLPASGIATVTVTL